MKVFVFGNPEIGLDSLPLRILPGLQKQFPAVDFFVADPNEDWGAEENLIAIDTIIGIDRVTVFDDLVHFETSPSLTMHDFDALANLRLLKKIGKIKTLKIVGLPPTISEREAIDAAAAILHSILP